MEELIFEDILSHYKSKISNTTDTMDSVYKMTKEVSELIELNWKGPAATACYEKLEESMAEITSVRGLLSETMSALSTIEIIDN